MLIRGSYANPEEVMLIWGNCLYREKVRKKLLIPPKSAWKSERTPGDFLYTQKNLNPEPQKSKKISPTAIFFHIEKKGLHKAGESP